MANFRFAKHRRLFFDQYSIADPRALSDSDGRHGAVWRVHNALFPIGGGNAESIVLSRADAEILESVAVAYDHLTTHPAGTESMVKQLREIRRALKALEKEGAP